MSIQIPHNDPFHTAVHCTSDDGVIMSHGGQGYRIVHLNGATLPAAFIGGIGTEPEYRRAGHVRAIITAMAEESDRRGVPLTLLHPFSFAYYRKFGFERVADHRVLELPMSALQVFERCSDLKRATDADREVLAGLYNAFAEGRNLFPIRDGHHPFPTAPDSPVRAYITSDEGGRPDGYVTVEIEKYYSVNRMVSVNLHVYEMVFTSPSSLDRLFGFLRMYEGELDSVKLHDCGASPEIELRLRHYMHTSITVLPDLMARINDVEAVLAAVRYPSEAGHFTVRSIETPGSPWAGLAHKTTGVWRVDYADGVGRVTRLAEDAPCDLSADIGALTQLVFGYESCGYEVARYTPGVEFHNPAADFFRAFPRRVGGVFEHF